MCVLTCADVSAETVQKRVADAQTLIIPVLPLCKAADALGVREASLRKDDPGQDRMPDVPMQWAIR